MTLCALLAACGTVGSAQTNALPVPSTPHLTVPQAVVALASRTWPCDEPMTVSGGAPNVQPATTVETPNQDTSVKVSYDFDTNTIFLRTGTTATLPAVGLALDRPDALRELAPGEWLLSANLRIESGATLRIAAPEVRWLKLRSDASGFIALAAYGGRLEIAGACITSWDAAHAMPDQNDDDGRSFVLARDGASMDISASDLRYLGYDAYESYGVAWRQTGASGQIVDSAVAYNYYGLYSFAATNLVIRGNHVYNNLLYGIDPHTGSTQVVIENNIVHGNGKHGIILAEECSDSVICGNIVYDNLHHGIVVYLRSDRTLVENNSTYGNGGQGININASSHNTISGQPHLWQQRGGRNRCGRGRQRIICLRATRSHDKTGSTALCSLAALQATSFKIT